MFSILNSIIEEEEDTKIIETPKPVFISLNIGIDVPNYRMDMIKEGKFNFSNNKLSYSLFLNIHEILDDSNFDSFWRQNT